MTDELPGGWVMTPLEDIAEINPRHSKNIDDAMAVTFISMPAISEKSPDFLFREERPLGDVRKGFTHFAEGDVLFAKITPCMENGKGAVAHNLRNGLGCGTTEVHVIRPLEGIDPRYIYRFLSQWSVRRLAKENFTGTAGQLRVPTDFIKGLSLPLAPLAEQKRIIANLEDVLVKARICQERLTNIYRLLRQFRQSVLAAACSGRLTADWRSQTTGAPASGYADAQPDDLPLGWKTVCVGDVIEDLKYGTSQKCGYEKRGVPVLRIPNVVKGIIDHKDLKYAALSVKEQKQLHLLPGDILIVRSNGSVSLVGKCALVGENERGFSYAGYLIRIRPNLTIISAEFLSLALSSYAVRLQIELEARSTSGVNNINSEEVRALRLFFPPLDEQREVVRRVNSMFALADKIEKRYQGVRQQVDRLPQSMLAKAFRGELVPTEAEVAELERRSYETAEQLLNRIRRPIDEVVGPRNRGPRMSLKTPIIDGISLDGFSEPISIDELRQTRCGKVPEKSGIYMIIRPSDSAPRFLRKSTGGLFKALDPSYPLKVVHENWVDGAHVMYVGMTAADGGLRSRLCQFFDFGAGKRVGHRGGRLLWHLVDSPELLVRWRTCAASKADAAETAAIASFKSVHDGRRPFANILK